MKPASRKTLNIISANRGLIEREGLDNGVVYQTLRAAYGDYNLVDAVMTELRRQKGAAMKLKEVRVVKEGDFWRVMVSAKVGDGLSTIHLVDELTRSEAKTVKAVLTANDGEIAQLLVDNTFNGQERNFEEGPLLALALAFLAKEDRLKEFADFLRQN